MTVSSRALGLLADALRAHPNQRATRWRKLSAGRQALRRAPQLPGSGVPDALDPRPPRLIDDQGRVWTCSWASWATGKQVRQMLARPQSVVVRDQDGVTRWLSQDDARALWLRIRRHFEVPGGPGADPDADGFTWAAHVWHHGDRRLLGFELFC